MSATYTTVHGNAGSLTYWARPGIELASSWILVGFISTVSQWELHSKLFLREWKFLGVTAMVQQNGWLLCNASTQLWSQARHSGLRMPQLWHRWQLQLRSDPWPRNSTCCRSAKKEKEEKFSEYRFIVFLICSCKLFIVLTLGLLSLHSIYHFTDNIVDFSGSVLLGLSILLTPSNNKLLALETFSNRIFIFYFSDFLAHLWLSPYFCFL